ncbi:hypothetical protein L3Y34_019539 [Caenorhabditis briggsae]|uniref:Uncharacterized protein n=1 Tax=Caenorhabditis briggsae TaxID=6238 RepID=A0AAE9IW78_CAEBR|nr:hypothetical protein L3Y34_019539 [Caenorhabditis briggsae]
MVCWPLLPQLLEILHRRSVPGPTTLLVMCSPCLPPSQSQSSQLGSTASDYYRSSTSPSESEANAWTYELGSIQPTFMVNGDFTWQQICQEFGLENDTFN